MVKRFSWFPRVALMGYAAMTIAGYLVMGPYFTLGWIAKGIEVALIVLLAVDVMRVYGSPMGLINAAVSLRRLDPAGPLPPDGRLGRHLLLQRAAGPTTRRSPHSTAPRPVRDGALLRARGPEDSSVRGRRR